MHYCTKCGTEVSDEVKFCPKCGAMQKINRKENDNNSNDYTGVMPKTQQPIPQEYTEIHENRGYKVDMIKLVLIGVFIGVLLLGLGFGGYYLYIKKYNGSSQHNNSKTIETTIDSKNTGTNKDDSKSKKNNTDDTNTQNKSSDYILNDSANVKLTDGQLNSLNKSDLTLARNEIYARHGFVFQTEPFKSYFSSKAWYKANPSFKGRDEDINEVEKYNVQLILKYENGK